MITAYQRGAIMGSDAARKGTPVESEAALKQVACATWEEARKNGYAHIDPKEEFVSGFVYSFGLALVVAQRER